MEFGVRMPEYSKNEDHEFVPDGLISRETHGWPPKIRQMCLLFTQHGPDHRVVTTMNRDSPSGRLIRQDCDGEQPYKTLFFNFSVAQTPRAERLLLEDHLQALDQTGEPFQDLLAAAIR